MNSSHLSETSQTLLSKLKDPADQQAWEDFVQRYGSRIYAWCMKSGLSDADACDVLQEVLVRLLKRFPSFSYNRQQGKFRNYLRTITENVIRDSLRKHQYRADQGVGGSTAQEKLAWVEDPGDAIAHLMEDLDNEFWRENLASIVEDLKKRRKNQTDLQVFELHELQGLSHEDIAEQLGKSREAVYTLLSRGRNKVKTEFDARFPTDDS
ncbi:MAG: sigma-70 family RNA polymerase sigma factor [Planctomycetota bacterium]|nr:sigma-70 family RNA polymerase sigma factor [Planctomycetota bacterium]